MKKIILTLVMALAFVLALTVAVFADTVHNENTVNYSATVTLDDGKVLPLFDENKNALIWYIDGTDEEGKTKYSSVRADDEARVTWRAESWNEVQSWDAKLGDGTTSIKSKIVVINLMDDDVVRNTGNATFLGKPMNNFKQLFNGLKNLEYCYLRLDTETININSFKGCTKLKYINLENLTQLKSMAQNDHFSGCTSLFDGQVLDLTKTQLTRFEGSGTFTDVPLKGVKFPETMTEIGSGSTFKNCTKLETVTIGSKVTTIGSNAFEGCTSLKAIYYVGTAEQLSASPINNVITATTKSYAEYKALSDKSGVYAVYDYSRCEAYNNGVHGALTGGNACAGTCSVCNDTVVSHSETAVTAVTIEYASYLSAGTKITSCTNEGCTHSTEETVDALFICQGVSASKTGNGLSLGFKVNNEAINTYTSTTGKTLKYGVFAGSQSNLGAKDIFDAEISEKVITAEIKATEFTAFDIKVVGFETDEQKSTLLAIGAYVEVSKDGVTKYSYMQEKDPSENAKYYFASYNDMLN